MLKHSDPDAIRINYTPESGLTFRAPVDATVMNMMAGTTDTLSKDSSYTLKPMQLYDFERHTARGQAVCRLSENPVCFLPS